MARPMEQKDIPSKSRHDTSLGRLPGFEDEMTEAIANDHAWMIEGMSRVDIIFAWSVMNDWNWHVIYLNGITALFEERF